jgi:CRP-like cAMP-binding protein
MKSQLHDAGDERSINDSKRSMARAGGLKPSEILFLPDKQKTLVNFLSRRECARFAEIQQTLGTDRQETLTTLSALKDLGYVNESLQDGEVHYHIKFVTSSSHSKNNIPGELWDALNLDAITFLRQVPLFKNLTEPDLEFIQRRIRLESYRRNDVIFWQGEPVGVFFVIKSGVIAVTNLLKDGTTNLLAYLEQGDFFGEGGLLTGRNASATITAFTPVEVLTLKKDDFYSLLSRNSEISIELARVLARRLSDSNVRLVSQQGETNLYLVIGADEKSGLTLLGSALALALASSQKGSTAYMEFPQQKLSSLFGFSEDVETYTHPSGYQVVNPALADDLPQLAQIALIVDQVVNNYKNIVISIPWELTEQLEYLVREASEVIVTIPATREAWSQSANHINTLRSQIRVNKTRLLTVLNHRRREQTEELTGIHADFELPFLETIPPLSEQRADNLPEPLNKVVAGILESLGFTNQIGVYLPTTIGVDQAADTSIYIEKTLAFMGKIFGGATHEQVRGVWNSNDAGLVAESIHLVRSFCSQATMDEHMGEVVDYVESLKKELKQEAMALEVNQKLMLI